MKVANDTPLLIGWVVGKIDPPKWTASFFLKGTFALKAGESLQWAEEPAQLSGDVYADDDLEKSLIYATDFAPLKPRADILVKATAHAPDGQPQPTFPVSIRVGKLAKALTVFGARQWKRGLIGTSGTTPPASVAAVPLTYENAFGGAGSRKNPLGRGRKTDDAPLIEIANRPVRSPSDEADPAGFGPLPAAWPQRADLRGTYDNAWLKTRWPWFPKDFDWGYFNAAPRDQQVDGYLVGNEELVLENLHAEIPLLKSRLPGLRPRCFVADIANGAERFREVPLDLDTLWIDVAAGIAVLTWRGRVDVKTFKLREIDRVVVAVEKMAEKPLPAESYRAAPAVEVAPPPAPADAAATDPWAQFDLNFASMDKEIASMDKDFIALEKELAEDLAKAQADMAKRKAEFIAQGADPAKLTASAADEPVLPSFDQAMTKLRETDPAAAAKAEVHRPWIAKTDADLASLKGDMDAIEQEMAADFAANGLQPGKKWTRESVSEAAAASQSFAGENLAELDLHDLTLSGLNLRGAILAKANLTGCRCIGADFREADLTEADLSKADLSQAKCKAADLTGAKVGEAMFAGISLIDATLTGVDLGGANLSGCNAEGADFAGVNLAGATLDGALLTKADFTSAVLEGTHLRRAVLRAAQCEGVKAKGIDCEEADITGLHGSGGSDFTGGNFKHVRADGAIFTESILDNADFTLAKLVKAQFGDASLRGTKFDRSDLNGAMFDDADLQRAIITKSNMLRTGLDRANLTEADCRGSNFYEAGFWDAVTEKANFREANLKGTLLRG